MKPLLCLPLSMICAGSILSLTGLAQPPKASVQATEDKLDVAQMKAVPDGNYLVTLELNGKSERLNFKVQGSRAKCVNSTDPAFKDVEGGFQLHQSGSFIGRFQGRTFRGTQLWIFRSDGTAAVREVPDRGEQQSAVPVTGDTLQVPKAK